MGSTPTTTPPSSSKYSSDLQQVLSRSIAIASLPLNQLNSQLTTLQNRSTALNSLNGKFSALQTALQGVSDAAVSSSAQVSDSSVLTAQSDSTAKPGSYAIHVVTAGAHLQRAQPRHLADGVRILPRNPSRRPLRSR